jgi:uncharacterized repeat protein (TIGR01451 family)
MMALISRPMWRGGLLAFRWRVAGLVVILGLISGIGLRAGTIDQVGTYGGWPAAWTPLANLDDPNDGLTTHLDFVGDATDRGVYWAQDANYIYFRVRVQEGTVISGTFTDTLLVMIDVDNDDEPDFAFVWDTRQSPAEKHSLEMTVFVGTNASWSNVAFDDVDGNGGQKFAPPDFAYATADGYIRTIDSQSTTTLGTTSYVDWAISWDYLLNKLAVTPYTTTYPKLTSLTPGHDWRISIGSISNGNDHNPLNTDIAGGADLTDPLSVGWSPPFQAGTGGDVEGRVYLDANGNSAYDAGEGLVGIDVDITDSGAVVRTVTTDADGYFLQAGLPLGNATVDLDETQLPAGVTALAGTTDPTVVTVTDGGTATDLNGYALAGNLTVVKTTTNGTSFTIGETVDYHVVISVPAGSSFANVVVTDDIEADIDVVATATDALTITASSADVTWSTETYAHTVGDVTTNQLLQVTLGTVANASGTTNGTITITYTGTVKNSTENDAGDTKSNDVTVTSTTGPITETDTASVDIVEPQITITKTVRNITPCTPSRSREGKIEHHAPEPDDILEYTLNIVNSSTDASAAYNLTIVDTLDVGLEYITNPADVDYSTPKYYITIDPDTTGDGSPGTPMTLTWGNDQSTPFDVDIPAGESLILRYHVRVRPSAEITAGQNLNNSATVTWYSLDGGSGRDGTGGANDYTATAATTTVTAWDDPSASTFTATGGAATVADDGTTAGAVTAGTLDGLSLLVLQDTASVTVTGDGVPNDADGDPDPFGTPSVTVNATASATIISDGTGSFNIDDLVIGAGATLTLQGDASYEIGAITMGVGSTLIVPDGAQLSVAGATTITGTETEANHAKFQSSTAGGGYTLLFGCSVDADYVHFDEIGDGYVQFEGPTDLDHAVFTDGSGANPYILYTYSASPSTSWQYLSFDKSDGKTVTIENTGAGTTIVVDHYMGPTTDNWMGGDTSENENPGAVNWANGTPARDLTSALAAPEAGGVLVNWQTSLEDGVCTYRVMRREERVWVEAGQVFAEAEPFQGAAYEYLDRAAVPRQLCDYRLDVVDNDGTTRSWDLGRIAAVAVAREAMPAARSTFIAPQRSAAILTRLPDQLISCATDTPTQTGMARKATITRTGLYQAPATGTLYNVGRELPRLAGDLVFGRDLSDFYTDTNVLWAGNLSIDGRPGVVPDPAVTAIHGAQGLEGVYHVEEDSSFTINPYLPPGPNWYFSRSFELKGGTTRAVPVLIPAPRSGTARITVNVRATSTTNHDLGITINGTAIAQAVWHEAGHYRIEANFASDLLIPGENMVHLQTDTAGSTKRLDYVEIQAPIDPALRDGDLLVRVVAGASGSLSIPGATHAVDATTFGEETDLAVTDGTVRGLSAGQLIFLTDTVRELTWSREQTLSVDDLRDANYVAVAPTDMLAELAPLLLKRRAEGRQTVALTLDRVQDVFGGGLFGPSAVARLARDLSPNYLLLGAGTTYDYKKNDPAGTTPVGLPCGFVHVREGMAASDDLYTNGYTVAVGRLPARTAAELRAIVTKIVAFQPGRRVALLADADDTGSGLDRFAVLQRELAGIMPSDLIESSGRSGNAVRGDLIEAIRGGDKLVAYQGHGGAEYLGYDGNRIFGVEHCNQVPPSAWLLSTCLTGSYIVSNASQPILSHRLLTTPTNGAVSVLCSTRYGDASIEHEIVRLSLTRMAQGGATWGDILLLLKRQLGETETGQIYTLLGDPALRAVDLADPRELAVLSPNAGDLVGGGRATIRFRLLGEGWAGETMEVCYRRGVGNWVRITTVETNADTTDYETEWTPPDDGRDYQVMVREVQP